MWARKNLGARRNVAATAVIHPSVTLPNAVTISDNVVLHRGVELGEGVTIYENTVIGRPPHRPSGNPRQSSETYIGTGTVIGSNVTVYDGTYIGAGCLIGDGARIREDCTILSDSIVGSNCTFQNDVQMGPSARVVDLSHITAGTEIGYGAFVSTGVLTMNDDSFAGLNRAGDPDLKPPTIGEFASVGGGAILLPNAHIGNNAIVAAGAVVTKDVQPGETVMGVPAKPRPKKDDWAKEFVEYHGA